ncbi:MAG: hypothetical protein IPK20_05025 [Betaproteobacteria bacterium]|nr:hypothetical protein [Betaproteobacteria bacterium]
MVFVVLALHLLSLVIALWAFWGAYKLVRDGGYSAVATNCKDARAEQLPSLAKQHATVLAIFGLWFLLVFIAVIAFKIPFSSWAGLYFAGFGIVIVGKRIIERRHGLQHT